MTRIVTDTTCGLSLETTRRLGISMVSQVINFGDQSYREGIDLDFNGFMTKLCERKFMPKTAAPFVSDYIEVFEQLAPAGESIVCIHPSADASGTVRSATIARESFPSLDIRIIDTRSVAGPLGVMVLEAQRLAHAGASAGQIEAVVHQMMQRARLYFLVDTLEFLRRGGRIGGAAALVGSLLQIKPILTFTNGRVEQFERERTRKRALARLVQVVAGEAAHGDDAHLVVMHTGDESAAEAGQMANELKQLTGARRVMLMELAPVVVTHVGPGALAVSFFAPSEV